MSNEEAIFFLKNDWLKQSWVADHLYGDRSTTNTSKLSRKIKTSNFDESELRFLTALKNLILRDLTANPSNQPLLIEIFTDDKN